MWWKNQIIEDIMWRKMPRGMENGEGEGDESDKIKRATIVT